MLGIWLLFSVFTLSTTGVTGSQLHSLFVAVAIVGASIIALFAPRARWVIMGLAVWLLVTQLLPQAPWTSEKITNVAIALGLITASIVSQLVGRRHATGKPAPQQPPDPPPQWLIPVVVIGGIVVLGASIVHLVTRKPTHAHLGSPCSNSLPCDTGLVCVTGQCKAAR